MKAQFDNVINIRFEHPTFFTNSPSIEQLNTIKKGDIVKTGICGELFWAEVIEIRDNEIKGIILNDLKLYDRHGLKFNDKIIFGKENIYLIKKYELQTF